MSSTFRLLLGSALLSLSFQSLAFNAKLAWDELVGTLKSDYAYLDKGPANTNALIESFSEKALKTTNKAAFIDVAQGFLRHFSDPHLNIGPYNLEDFSVYPTGSDIYAQFNQSHAQIYDIKRGSDAFKQGLRPGMRILSIDGLSVRQAIEDATLSKLEALSPAQQNYALNVALGGKRYQKRRLEIQHNHHRKFIELAATYDHINQLSQGPSVTIKTFDNLGYIRFNNVLGNENSAKLFKDALPTLAKTKALIIDLRNTPSGGNTGVAEPILGHFVQQKAPYQGYRVQKNKQPYAQAPYQQAYAIPQTPFIDKPYVVLAGRWTGSMGEGMTIALDALGAKAVIGAPMADLLGGIKQVTLSKSEAVLEVGFERMYHLDGRFREDYEPTILLKSADTDKNGDDPALRAAVKMLSL